jgi:hypothetical protein
MTVPKALEAVRFMMHQPNPDDALRQWIAELTIAHYKSAGADTRYADEASARARKDASTSVEQWKAAWGC